MTWTSDQLKQHFDARLGDLIHRLDGFPQEFATKAEVSTLDTTLDTIRTDHVQRREFDGVKTNVSRILGVLSLAGLLFGFGFAAVERGQVSHSEISQQIQSEAPWVQDRPQVEAHITALENEVATLKVQLTQAQALDRLLCRIHKLPAC